MPKGYPAKKIADCILNATELADGGASVIDAARELKLKHATLYHGISKYPVGPAAVERIRALENKNARLRRLLKDYAECASTLDARNSVSLPVVWIYKTGAICSGGAAQDRTPLGYRSLKLHRHPRCFLSPTARRGSTALLSSLSTISERKHDDPSPR